jgi:uncharacterized membrane protein YsdA (DUF1294 family)
VETWRDACTVIAHTPLRLDRGACYRTSGISHSMAVLLLPAVVANAIGKWIALPVIEHKAAKALDRC